jgi:TusA-related sulfurtransferase
METKTYDIRGQICPSTLLTALKEINSRRDELKNNSIILVFLTDNRDAVSTIPSTVDSMGYRADVEPLDGYYRITIQNRAGEVPAE